MAMTLEELNCAYRTAAVREIENMMGRYSFFSHRYAAYRLSEAVVQADDCILDMPWGSYTGYQGVKTCYLEDHGDRSYPETWEFMVGLFPMHTHTTGVIEVAGDLKTARGCWLSPSEGDLCREWRGGGHLGVEQDRR